MSAVRINEQVIEEINAGKEVAFATLYDCYYSYLCVFATTYIFDAEEAKEVVNDVFVNIWENRGRLPFPIHPYLVRSVKNRCLNSIRAKCARERVMEEYMEELMEFQREFCENDESPQQMLEMEELTSRVGEVIDSLPEKCRLVFKRYLYDGQSPAEIAAELSLSVNTIRVQIKHAMDRIRQQLGPMAFLVLLFFHGKL